MGLLVWFFSTSLVSNAPGVSVVCPLASENQPHVDRFPYSSIKSYSLYSSSFGESLDSSNQEVKKK